MIKLTSEICAMFRFEAVRPCGTRRVLADWFPNLITDNGLNLISGDGWLRFCQVGAGSTPPSNGDTTLASFMVSSSNNQSSTSGAQSTAPYFCWRRNVYRFAAGVAAGNISEVGISPSATGNLLSRALILDSSGNPTTISVLSDEILYVTYEIRCYPPTADNTFTLNISGVDYEVTTRAAAVTNNGYWNIEAYGQNSGLNIGGEHFRATNGAISGITGLPSGTQAIGSSINNASYSAGSHQREGTVEWDLNFGNIGGISAMYIRHGIGTYQLGFSPAIPKNNADVLSMTFRHSWARKS